MLLDHPSLEPFEPLVADLFDLAFGGTLKGLAAAGLSPGDEWHTQAALVFRAACLPGLQKAQDAVGEKVIELELQIRKIAKEESAQRLIKDVSAAGHCHVLRKVLQDRQLVLRRLVDGMLWMLFWPKKWLLRRLRVQGGIKAVNAAELRELLNGLVHQHARDKESVWIICDLSTLAQLGDVIYAQWKPGSNHLKITIAELKVGRVNNLLYEVLRAPARRA